MARLQIIGHQYRFALVRLFPERGEQYFGNVVSAALQERVLAGIDFYGVDGKGRGHVFCRFGMNWRVHQRHANTDFIMPARWAASVAPEVAVAMAFFEKHVLLKKLTRQAYLRLRTGTMFRGRSQPRWRPPRMHKERVGRWSRLQLLEEVGVSFIIAHNESAI